MHVRSRTTTLAVLFISLYSKERDTESGNDYFGARYYASSMGRFMSPDPSGLYLADPTNPQSLNLYSYVLNNPLKLVDPTGLGWCYYGNTDSGAAPSDDPSDYDMDSPNAADCQGGQWHDVSTTVNVNGNDGSSTVDTVDTGSAQEGQFVYQTLSTTHTYIPGSYYDCVRSGLDAFSLQSGVQKATGGRLGNGWLAGAFLGNSVQSVGDFVQALGQGRVGGAANTATAETLGDTAGAIATKAASQVPNGR